MTYKLGIRIIEPHLKLPHFLDDNFPITGYPATPRLTGSTPACNLRESCCPTPYIMVIPPAIRDYNNNLVIKHRFRSHGIFSVCPAAPSDGTLPVDLG